jgi:Fic family protein
MKKLESPPPKPAASSFEGLALGIFETENLGYQQSLLTNIPDFLHEIDKNYYYWSKVKYLGKKWDTPATEVWHYVKLIRKLRSKTLKFGKYNFQIGENAYLSQQLHEFDLNLGGGFGNNLIPEAKKQQFLINSIMEEAAASSIIEGAVTTRQKAKEMLHREVSPRNKSDRMIVNNYQTIKFIAEIKNDDFSLERLLEIHQLITSQTLENSQEEGALRQHDNISVVDTIESEVVHLPPSHTELSVFLEELTFFFNNDDPKLFLHPVVKASIIHFLIGFFHPFADGNGRTARALFYWYLLKKGYWLTEYLSISRIILDSKTQYYHSFLYVENDENDLTYFVHYQVKTLKKALDDFKKYVHKELQEKQKYIAIQQTEGLNLRQIDILNWLVENPNRYFTVKEIETRLQVANQTARTDLDGLVALSYLTKIQVNKKESRYIRGSKSI